MVAPALSPAPEVTGSAARTRAWVAARSLAALGGGALVYLSVPPRTLWWLAPLGFAVLGWLLHGRRARAALGYGFLFGMGFMTPLLAWTGIFVGPVAWLPLSALEALLVGVPCMAVPLVTRLRGGVVLAALVWVAGEYLRSLFPFGGFPWGRVAFSQPEGPFLHLAALGGTPLIGFAVALTGFGLGDLARRVAARQTAPRLLAVPALAVLVPLLAAVATGPLVGTDADAGEVTVAAVQGNVPRAGLDFNAQRRAVLDNHVRRTEQLAADVRSGAVARPDLVIWPENASDIDPLRNRDAYQLIDMAAKDIGVPIALGAVVVGDDRLPRNTVILWDPVRGPIDTYTKRRLQPFGETMPMRSFFKLFSSAVERAGNFVPGDEATVFAMGEARLALVTCYEVAFDGVVRDSVLNGSNLLAVPTNNATFGRSEMTYQQLAMDRVRAVEHGRAVVVAATSGVSAIVAPDGSVRASTDLFTPAALVERVPLRTATTIADRLGAWPERVMVTLALAALVVAVARARRDKVK
ncbi:apolipoprotein N-acyltransferase [Actinokineospora globicatena]|uniref:apolipoprotein N-acyltransferase n=1 Tax=Actinokineospora globicatena TaxID=103729 RepID=UPI0020A3E594|nr:apolipoprotein N-acyltransferase [Actinokineospora globicatena]MCP2306686.1 apolipoprotein N-acyltransferase [Actinokineospora globicatena]GLW82199.1 apolipoprotein N-acyltransferase [Actinokineospora globicatena]GLW88992.1 apolipoprotein N-acyltransferase [Actinokineospora globicatena]